MRKANFFDISPVSIPLRRASKSSDPSSGHPRREVRLKLNFPAERLIMELQWQERVQAISRSLGQGRRYMSAQNAPEPGSRYQSHSVGAEELLKASLN